MLPISMHWRQTNSCMRRAEFSETRSHPSIQNLAKAPKLRCQAEHPHLSSRSGGLLGPSPLRTVHAIFTAHGSSA